MAYLIPVTKYSLHKTLMKVKLISKEKLLYLIWRSHLDRLYWVHFLNRLLMKNLLLMNRIVAVGNFIPMLPKKILKYSMKLVENQVKYLLQILICKIVKYSPLSLIKDKSTKEYYPSTIVRIIRYLLLKWDLHFNHVKDQLLLPTVKALQMLTIRVNQVKLLNIMVKKPVAIDIHF